ARSPAASDADRREWISSARRGYGTRDAGRSTARTPAPGALPPLLRRSRLPAHRSDPPDRGRNGFGNVARRPRESSPSSQRGVEMNEIQLRDGLFELFPPDGASDWEDVLRRAASPRRVRRLTLLLAAAFLVVLAIGSALALSGRFGGLCFGTLVNDLTPRERFLLTELDMNGKVELIAQRGSTAFYVIRRTDGRLCYSMGEVRQHLTPAQREAQFRFGG